ncbi:MAG TPA: Fe-S cluster assembly protein SufD [Stellaceae bacterium]|nr:Fe-S cluster assembly protein SufD [Stellaceae bacterium]
MSAVVNFPVKPEARPYIEAFTAPSDEPDWLARSRRHGLDRFAKLGFPSRRSEDWRYLDLRALEEHPLFPVEPPEKPEQPGVTIVDINDFILVLVDGRWVPHLSWLRDLPEGVWFGSLRTAMTERPDLARAALAGADDGSSFDALNAAFASDGFILDIAPDVELFAPIEIVHLSLAGGAAHTRNLISIGARSRVIVAENFFGTGRYWRNDVAAWRVGEGAALTRVAVIEEDAEATHLDRVSATLGDASRLDGFVLMLGGGTVRHEASVTLAGADAQCRINGAFIVAGGEEANIVTAIDHATTGGTTSELIKGVAAGRAHGAFQGKIIVREGAQRTDARQTSRNLILGRRAVIDTKPELEILADDVKCAHGASVGELDEAALFYLRARGIPLEEARRILVEGFLAEPIENIAHVAVRQHLLRRLSLKLGRLEDWS